MFKKLNIIMNDRGVSLLEILIALLLSSIVIAVVFQVYITQHKNWTIQGEVTDMQQNARAAIDEMGRQIRMAGYIIPDAIAPIEGFNTNPDTIVIRYSPDGCNARIIKPMPTKSSELDVDPDVSCFSEGKIYYIYSPVLGCGNFFEATAVQKSPTKLQHNKDVFSNAYKTDAIVLSMEKVKFYIDNSDTLHPNLMMAINDGNPQVYAENIYDLHFKYKMNNGLILDEPAIAKDVRGVTIVIYARTANIDLDNIYDPYRRRAYVSEVNLRNLDI